MAKKREQPSVFILEVRQGGWWPTFVTTAYAVKADAIANKTLGRRIAEYRRLPTKRAKGKR